jgi:hypothetical protein
MLISTDGPWIRAVYVLVSDLPPYQRSLRIKQWITIVIRGF